MLDDYFAWRCLDFTTQGATAILGALVSSMLTFIVVIVSSLLLVVQLASAQLTPRIIASTFQHPLIRIALSAFVFAYAISITVLGRIEQVVPQFAVMVAIFCNVLSLILFLYFIGAIGMNLRPAHVLSRVAGKGREVIFEVYPAVYDPSDQQDERRSDTAALGDPTVAVRREGASGVLLAFDTIGLVNYAREHQVVIEVVPRVGDFVASGEPLFYIYGTGSVDSTSLRKMAALGSERTLEQDPGFAFRIVVDIACKALSPAINDPTTAVLAIDQIHRLLRCVGNRRLHSGTQSDATGALRLIFPTPTWEDFVWLATAEIRHYGGDSIQVCQRLHAMLEHLMHVLPEPRWPALREQLRLLEAVVDRRFPDPEDRERVRTCDSSSGAMSSMREEPETDGVN